MAFVFRPVLLFGIHSLVHNFLRKRILKQYFRKKLFYFCPTIEEPDYFRAKISGEKSIF